MDDSIRIRLSVGLIVLAVIHAVILAVTMHAVQTPPTCGTSLEPWKVPSYQPSTPTAGQIEKLAEPPQVNLRAQGEVKQQITRCPQYCPPQVITPFVRPAPKPLVLVPTTTPTATPSPTLPVREPTLAPELPSILTPTSNTQPLPPKKSFQLALFVGSDAKSQQLLQWFTHDANLVNLKASCEFQVYSENNPLYRSRYAEIVPVEQFPVVLFQDSTGGHIHAAGRSMIPSTALELHSDLSEGYALYQQAKQAQRTGALKTRGYSWDDSISPGMVLSATDCPDDFCPPENEEAWKPGSRVRDLFNESEPRNALMWLSAGEIATVALLIVAVILIGFILIKRGM